MKRAQALDKARGSSRMARKRGRPAGPGLADSASVGLADVDLIATSADQTDPGLRNGPIRSQG